MADKRIKLTTILRRFGITKSALSEQAKWMPTLRTAMRTDSEGRVSEKNFLRALQLAGFKIEEAAADKRETIDELKWQYEKEKTEQAKIRTELLRLDKERARDSVVEVEAIKKAGGEYVRRIAEKLNNFSSELAPLLVGVEDEDEAKEILDEGVVKVLNEWASWDIDKIARDEREQGTHRRSGSRSWRTENKKPSSK